MNTVSSINSHQASVVHVFGVQLTLRLRTRSGVFEVLTRCILPRAMLRRSSQFWCVVFCWIQEVPPPLRIVSDGPRDHRTNTRMNKTFCPVQQSHEPRPQLHSTKYETELLHDEQKILHDEQNALLSCNTIACEPEPKTIARTKHERTATW